VLTPTYGRDLEICTLLCESVTVTSLRFSKHYLRCRDCRPAAVRAVAGERRIIVPASAYLPGWLRGRCRA